MTQVRTAPPPQNIIIGVFLLLAAVVFAVAPIPLLYRSLGIVMICYLIFSYSGSLFAYLTVLLAPVTGLITGDSEWLVMLPIMLSSGLLAVIGLDYAWRYSAIVISPILYLIPPLVVWQISNQPLFAVDLPWQGSEALWLGLHGLTAFAGVLVAVYLDRRRERQRQGGAASEQKATRSR